MSSKRRASLYGTFGLRFRNECIAATGSFASKTPANLGNALQAWILVQELLSKPRNFSDQEDGADEEVYTLITSSVEILEIPAASRRKAFERSGKVSHQDALAQDCQAPGRAAFVLNTDRGRLLKSLILEYKYLSPAFHVRTAHERCPIRASRSLFTTSKSGGEIMWHPEFQLDPCARIRNKLPDH